MDAMKNILIFTSLFIGFLATVVLAEEQADVVYGPHNTATEKQAEPASETQVVSDTETEDEKVDEKKTSDATPPAVNSMFVVKKISFEGVKTVSEDMLRTLIQTQVGDEVSQELLTQDLKSLYKDTGFFSEAKVDTQPAEGGGLEIIYKVVESPKISGINIIGNENLNTGKLRNEITLRPDEIYSDRRRWESERTLTKLYHDKGYYLVGIQTHLDNSEDETHTVRVTFEINEGPRVRIEEINFIGNELLLANTLRKKNQNPNR